MLHEFKLLKMSTLRTSWYLWWKCVKNESLKSYSGFNICSEGDVKVFFTFATFFPKMSQIWVGLKCMLQILLVSLKKKCALRYEICKSYFWRAIREDTGKYLKRMENFWMKQLLWSRRGKQSLAAAKPSSS